MIFIITMINPKTNERNYVIDILKFLAILAVVYTHSRHNNIFDLYLGDFLISSAVPIFMVITGYNYAQSTSKRKIELIGQYYTKENLKNKFMRILPAYLFIALLQFVIILVITNQVSEKTLFLTEGPGSYYTLMLIQIILIYPLIYFALKKHPIQAFLIILVSAFFYDYLMCIVKEPSTFSNQFYRHFFARHLLTVALGCLLYLYKQKIKWWMLVTSAIIGAVYLIAMRHFGIIPVFIYGWKTTSYIAAFWAFAVVGCCIKYIKINLNGITAKIIKIMGNSTFHIMLIQACYYFFGAGLWFTLAYNNVVLDIAVCLSAGMLFYFIEQIIRRGIEKLKKQKRPSFITGQTST